MPNKQIQVSKHSSVVKGNYLIEQLGVYTINEFRLLAYFLAHYDSRPEDSVEGGVVNPEKVVITPATVKTIFPNMKQSSSRQEIYNILSSINAKPLRYDTEKKDRTAFWFDYIDIIKETGDFVVALTHNMKSHILNLGNKFTPYRLKSVSNFTTARSWFLYELLRKRLTARRWDVDLADLRTYQGYTKKYKRWVDYKKWVLTPAIKEINESSDIKVDYEPDKRGGRAIVAILFTITPRTKTTEIIEIETPLSIVEGYFKRAKIAKKTRETLFVKIGRAEVLETVAKGIGTMYNNAVKKRTVPAKYITGTINKIVEAKEAQYNHEKNETSATPGSATFKAPFNKELAIEKIERIWREYTAKSDKEQDEIYNMFFKSEIADNAHFSAMGRDHDAIQYSFKNWLSIQASKE